MAVLGSSHIFADQYLDKEENAKILVGLCHKVVSANVMLSFTSMRAPLLM